MNKKITVLLADDHTVVREGLRALLESEDITIVGDADTGRKAVELAQKFHPDVVLMDISMPNLNGLQATRQILAKSPNTKIIALSSHNDDQYIQELIDAGAIGYLIKQTSGRDLAKSIQDASKGKPVFTPAIAKRLADHARETKLSGRPDRKLDVSLTSRETEVVQLVAEGMANKQIAAELLISIKTVEKYRQQVMDKLNIHETAGLTRYAIANRIVDGNVRQPLS